MGYKAYSDSYLMSLTKAEIIELLRVAEHNFFATEEALNNSAKAGMEIAEKYDEAKRLLKAAIEDMDNARHGINCGICGMQSCDINNVKPECKYRWQYADEAEKLLKEK